jgi:hypothetical protein
MNFFKILEKKKVPDELPTLVTEDINKGFNEKKEISVKLEEQKKSEIQQNEITQMDEKKNNSIQNSIETKILQDNKEIIEKNKVIEKNINENIDLIKKVIVKEPTIEEKNQTIMNNPKLGNESFFIKLQENLNKEMNSLDKLEEYYNKTLLPEDTLSEMKNYWEKQSSDSVIQNVGKDFQEKITQKIINLQELEKNWQDMYFNLIEKEEKIKTEEKELKKMLAEFIGFCKKRVNTEKTNENKVNNEKTNEKREKIKKKRKSK